MKKQNISEAGGEGTVIENGEIGLLLAGGFLP